MKKVVLPLAELAVIAATRGMLGAGVGLLVADKVPEDRRVPIARALVTIGVVTTIPLLWDVVARMNRRSRG